MTNYARLIQQVAGGFVRYSARLEYADSTSKTGRNRLHQRFPNIEGRETAMRVRVLRDTKLRQGVDRAPWATFSRRRVVICSSDEALECKLGL